MTPSATPRPTGSTPSEPADTESEAELRHLTVLFCDLVGSTELAARTDPEELRDILGAYHAICTEVVAAHGGHIAQYLGDGVMAYFGYPQAHEDSAERAVSAGLGIQAALGARLEADLAARIGVHTGRVVVGEVGSGSTSETLAIGATSNVAARVQHVAEAGTLAITNATLQLVAGSFAVEDIGTRTLKGLATPVAVFRVERALSSVDRRRPQHHTTFVGRQAELHALRDAWERAQAGEGQAVLLIGEPGIGKSRLVEQFEDGLADDSYVTSRALSFRHQQHTPFGVIGDLFRRSVTFIMDAQEPQRLDLLTRALVEAGLDPTPNAPLIAGLLGIDTAGRYPPRLESAEQERRALIELLVTWVCRSSQSQTQLLLIEDLQWSDPSTLETLAVLIEKLAGFPILLVLTARTEFHVPWPPRAHHTVLRLARLDRGELEEMLSQQLGGDALTPDVLEAVVSRSDGVPLFAEELARNVREQIGSQSAPTAIPDTLHDLLMARLDRLGRVRGIMQVAAVIGREFSFQLLQAVAKLDDGTLRAALDASIAADVVRMRGVPPHAIYEFRHALLQQSAYDSMIRKRRRQLHANVAGALTEQFTALASSQPELVAQHWSAAGDMRRAFETWSQAGSLALERSAYREAKTHFELALEAIGTGESVLDANERARFELDLQLKYSYAIQMALGFAVPECEAPLARARALAEQLGDLHDRMSVLYSTFTVTLSSGDTKGAGEIASAFLQAAERDGDPIMLARAHMACAAAMHHLGEPRLAIEHGTAARACVDGTGMPVLERQSEQTVLTQVQLFTAFGHTLLGSIDKARSICEELKGMARADGCDTGTACLALLAVLSIQVVLRDVEGALEVADEIRELARPQGIEIFDSWADLFGGWALAMHADPRRGVEQMRNGLEVHKRLGQRLGFSQYLVCLGEAQLLLGDVEGATRSLVGAEDTAQATRWVVAEVKRLHAAIAVTRGDPPDVIEALYREALEASRECGSVLGQLRVSTLLAAELEARGRTREGRDLLAPLCAQFVEGLDAPDVVRARAALERLR